MSLVRQRLLFVDDEPGIRQTLPVILRKYGFAVTFTAKVSEAIEVPFADATPLCACPERLLLLIGI